MTLQKTPNLEKQTKSGHFGFLLKLKKDGHAQVLLHIHFRYDEIHKKCFGDPPLDAQMHILPLIRNNKHLLMFDKHMQCCINFLLLVSIKVTLSPATGQFHQVVGMIGLEYSFY